VGSKSRPLRTGYTTGACAAAAAKAAALALFGCGGTGKRAAAAGEVEIPFPDGTRHSLKVERTWQEGSQGASWASVIKDGGDDPDVTHGAEIMARVVFRGSFGTVGAGAGLPSIAVLGGEGVGVVTRPGLSVAVGEPAISPTPRKMVVQAVTEAVRIGQAAAGVAPAAIDVTICVREGERIARKTLNARLGVVGGISILGTTGIVRPLSAEAWTATITASMSVARAMGRREIVLSAGRSSERAHIGRYGLPEESYVMMGDYLEYALLEARGFGFDRVHLCSQWAKMLKIAMGTPQTHVSHGPIDLEKAAAFLKILGAPLPGRQFNTAREMFDFFASREGAREAFPLLCAAARGYAESVTGGIPVCVHLVSYGGEVVATDG
jgi:cobalt-precorrin-5B (C1)-methyltransferase